MINSDGIKQLLEKSTDAEIRMMLTQAREMGIEFDDKLIVDLFKKGIVVDIIIRNADEADFLPKRLEKYIANGNTWHEGFVKIKIVNSSSDHILNPLEIAGLLMKILDRDIKVASELEEENGFVRMRFISSKNDRFLNIKEIRYALANVLSNQYTFLVDEI